MYPYTGEVMPGQHEFTVLTNVSDEQQTFIVHRLGQLVLGVEPKDIFWYEETQTYQLGTGNNFWLHMNELPERDGYSVRLTSRYGGQSKLENAAQRLCEELKAA